MARSRPSVTKESTAAVVIEPFSMEFLPNGSFDSVTTDENRADEGLSTPTNLLAAVSPSGSLAVTLIAVMSLESSRLKGSSQLILAGSFIRESQ
eukprot:CAMPEP_0204310450 /NCGR_PEP_ID=MMETSP0469-20131031/1729_1 /ASSEMBLY_ACC=CAM_ASM_000384 /TAXON_ID=2969 /ORGANISM="Oxyrrhis marina" /LENGTH=93 /DNA_ID=CAMNT_0051290229 /DNA_START=2785 /DNA_END=3066 /DNA_ORIENTATION=+